MTDQCPALTDLSAAELPLEIEDHVAGCRRCKALRSLLPKHKEESRTGEVPASTIEMQRRPSTGDFGLATTFDNQDNLVVYVAAVREGEAIVVPVSADTRFATEWDLLISDDVLGYAAMAEVWNHGVVLVEQLSEALVAAPDEVRERVASLIKATESGEVPEGFQVGVPVLGENDPRLLFQEGEAETARSYWHPRMLLARAATVGELVTLRQEELKVSEHDLEALDDQPSWLNDLRANRLKLQHHEDALVGLMKALHLRASSRLRLLVLQTIDQQERLAQMSAGVSFNRRRVGTSGAAELGREDVRRAEIEAFATRLMCRLDAE
jgi:hypothetical protein